MNYDIAKIAEAYKAAPDQFDQIPEDQLPYLRKFIDRQYCQLRKGDIYFDFVDYKPYSYTLVDEMRDYYIAYGTIKVNISGNDSKLWGPFHNLQFRAIHDYVHVTYDLDFNFLHEVRAYEEQIRWGIPNVDKDNDVKYIDFDLYEQVLRSEIIYQAAYKEHFNLFDIGTQKIVLDDLLN